MEIYSSTEDPVSLTKTRHYFSFCCQKVTEGLNSVVIQNTVITVVAQIIRGGEQELLPPPPPEDTVTEDNNIQLGGEKGECVCKNSNIPEGNLLLQQRFCRCDTGSAAMKSFITDLQRGDLQAGQGSTALVWHSWHRGREAATGASLRLLIVSEIVSRVSNPVGTLLLGTFR